MRRRAMVIVFMCMATFGFAQQLAPFGKILDRCYSQIPESERFPVWVYFKDKGVNAEQKLALAPQNFLGERSIQRRQRMITSGAMRSTSVVTTEDLPMEQSYVSAVAGIASKMRQEMKWFNCISVLATKAEIEQIRRLPSVKEIELVARFKKRERVQETSSVLDRAPQTENGSATNPLLNYGSSLTQNQQINVVNVHNLGINGAGVLVGVFDDAFPNITVHPALATRPVIAKYDFIDNSPILSTNDSHGQETFSTVGGFAEGSLIGPAYGATFVLARTENAFTETPVEEDAWARAIIWADSIGIDVSTTSLGYDSFDSPWPSYTWQDMDGNTTVITRAADRAVSLGIVCVNSAGNAGDNTSHNTLGAPADAFNVITAGAVTSSGTRSSFSSVGPTVDGRIKPDIMAMGSGVQVALGASGYTSASGTSFSCPLSAGVAALVVSGNPGVTPFQVREAMRQTASRANAPDRLYGWGILNALNAVNYAWIDHTPLANTEDTTARTVRVKIRSRIPLVADSSRVMYGINGSFSNSALLIATGTPNEYSAQIPYVGNGVNVTYYIKTKNANVSNRLPLGNQFFSYQVGADAAGPSILHMARGNASISSWPPRISAVVMDASGVDTVRIEYSKNGVAQTPIAITSTDSSYSDTLRIARSQIQNGDTIAYRIIAKDRSHLANTTAFPASGTIKFAVKSYDNSSSNFEATNASFVATNDWQYGVRGGASPVPNSGTKYWGTILNGNYTQGPRLSSLTTPTYTVFSNRASFTFYHWYEAESRFDGGNVKISINGGAFQTIFPACSYPIASIYNGFGNPLAGQPGYANTSGTRWSKATFDLTGIAVEGNTVAVRFDFGADNNTLRYRGWYIDDFAADGFGTPILTGAEDHAFLPTQFALEQNYPNPFNPTTIIRFSLSAPGFTSLKVFDLLGREVLELANQEMQAGNHQIVFDGSKISSGTYFYKLQSGKNVATKKLLLLK